MKKTAKEWLMSLKDEHRDLALANMFEREDDTIYHTLQDALYHQCKWDTSPQGEDFWGDIYDQLEAGTYFDAPQLTPEECTAKAKAYMYGKPIFPEDDAERQKYPLAQTDLFFPDADAAFSNFCLLNQQKHSPDTDGVTWADDKSVGDGSQLRRHLLEFWKAVQDGDYEKADTEIRAVNFRGRELTQRWIKKMPPFNNLDL